MNCFFWMPLLRIQRESARACLWSSHRLLQSGWTFCDDRAIYLSDFPIFETLNVLTLSATQLIQSTKTNPSWRTELTPFKSDLPARSLRNALWPCPNLTAKSKAWECTARFSFVQMHNFTSLLGERTEMKLLCVWKPSFKSLTSVPKLKCLLIRTETKVLWKWSELRQMT